MTKFQQSSYQSPSQIYDSLKKTSLTDEKCDNCGKVMKSHLQDQKKDENQLKVPRKTFRFYPGGKFHVLCLQRSSLLQFGMSEREVFLENVWMVMKIM